MGRDWEATSVIADILVRMSHFGDNTAEFPFCMSQIREPDGRVIWCVDLHVRIPRYTEFDISTEGETLTEALRGAYLGLNNEAGVARNARRANEAFGVSV